MSAETGNVQVQSTTVTMAASTNGWGTIIVNLLIELLQSQGPVLAQALINLVLQLLQNTSAQAKLAAAIEEALAKKQAS